MSEENQRESLISSNWSFFWETINVWSIKSRCLWFTCKLKHQTWGDEIMIYARMRKIFSCNFLSFFPGLANKNTSGFHFHIDVILIPSNGFAIVRTLSAWVCINEEKLNSLWCRFSFSLALNDERLLSVTERCNLEQHLFSNRLFDNARRRVDWNHERTLFN